MEEILASIRLIISDDAKKGPAERDEGHSRRPAAPRQDAAPLSALPEEDVLDLTDELVFPEEQPAPAAAPNAVPSAQEHPVDEEAPAEDQPHAPQVESAANAPFPQAADTQHAPSPRPDYAMRQAASAEPRQELSHRPAQTGSRTVWSRRELPGSPVPMPGSGPRIAPEAVPAKSSQRNWAEDIQMPIPDQGPVSLIAQGETQGRIQEAAKEDEQSFEDMEAGNEAAASPGGLDTKDGAAVAALAESLVRSAVGAMDSDELETARDVEFDRLDEERKAEVTEKFASAIQRESVARDTGPLPTLLDEVLRHEFIRESAPYLEPEPVEDSTGIEPSMEESAPQAMPSPAARHFGAELQSGPDIRPQWEPSNAAPQVRNAPRPQPAETSAPDKPVVQAQFVGASQSPFPAPAARTLEDAVRDMLRPLLMQWLNENMPRILESAIREEIATRGLLPKAED